MLRFCFLLPLFLAFLATPLRAEEAKVIAPVLQPFVDDHVLAGAVTLVADKDKVLSLETVGYSDVAAKKAMKADDLFWIASMSKPITGAALMILVDEGKVAIDDPVEKFLPEFKGQMVIAEKDGEHMLLKRPAHPITVKNVLNHTSGLPFKSPIEVPTIDLYPLAVRVRSYAMLPLNSEPDTKYVYSNAGINIAGRIVEVVSGMPFEDFVAKRFFEPLGMKDTTFKPTAAQLARLAKTYRGNKDKSDLEAMANEHLKEPFDDPSREACPAGGYFSTASDVGRFCQMLLNGGTLDGKRYLSEAAVKTMTSKQTIDALPNGYGLGFSTEGDTFGHGGAYATNMTVDTKRGLVLVFMVQSGGWRTKEGGKIGPAFTKAAQEKFGK